MSDARISKIILQYGYDAQSRQCIEEMAELTQAINKFWRKGLKCGKVNLAYDNALEKCMGKEYEDLIEEIADVEIMLEQMKEMLHCESDVSGIKEEKLDRQIERIRTRQEEKEEMTSAEAMERMEAYRHWAETDGNANYDIKLHNVCIKALQEKVEREGKRENGI